MIRPMNHGQPIGVGGSRGQLGYISGVVGFELVASPSRGNLRYRIEILNVGESGYNLIVVPPNDERSERPDALGHFVRIRTVIDDIPQAEDALPTAVDGCEGSL